MLSNQPMQIGPTKKVSESKMIFDIGNRLCYFYLQNVVHSAPLHIANVLSRGMEGICLLPWLRESFSSAFKTPITLITQYGIITILAHARENCLSKSYLVFVWMYDGGSRKTTLLWLFSPPPPFVNIFG